MGVMKKVDIATLDTIATYQQFNDVLTLIPDSTRMAIKFLGPLATGMMKLDMFTQSLTKTLGLGKKEMDGLGDGMEETAGKVESSGGIMGMAVSVLTLPFKALGGTLKLVGGMFTKLLLGILPLIGIFMAVTGIVMLFVAAFDKGGGSLKQWLSDLPVIGGLMDVMVGTIERIKALWETLKANITLPEGTDSESFMAGIIDGLTMVVEIFIAYWTTISTMVFGFITALAEAGIFQAIIDGFVSIYEGFMGAWDMINSALGDGGIQSFFDMILGLWDYLISFLVNSGIFGFIGDLIEMVGEFIGTWMFLAGAIISVVIRIVKFVYPYIAPYYKMLIAAFGIILAVVMGVIRTVMKVFSALMAVLRGDFDKAGDIIKSIGDVWTDTFDGIKTFFKQFVNSLIDFISPLFKIINGAIGLFNKIPGIPDLPKINVGGLKLAKGGVVSGPRSGYSAELHGTEAVVPLPDGRSIPVTMQGNAGGGGETTVNINVSGANGDPRKIARMVGEEVGRLFKSRSRSGGFTRGV